MLIMLFMSPRCTPSVMFLLAACALNAQVGVEGVLPSSVSSTQVQSAIGNDESNAGLEKSAVRLQSLLREEGYFLATVIVDKLKDGRQGLRVFPGIFDGKSAKVSGTGLRISASMVQAIALPVTSSGVPVTADQLAGVTKRLNALPGVAAKAQVGPGSAEGTAQLTIGIAEDDARVYRLSADNFGTKALGENRATLRAEFNGDASRLDVRGTVSDASYASAGLGYKWATGVEGSVSRVGLSVSRYTTEELSPIKGDSVSLEGGRTGFLTVGTKGSLKLVTDWSLRRTTSTGVSSGVRLDGAETAGFTLGFDGDRKDGLLGGGTNIFSVSATGGYTHSDNALIDGGFARYNYSLGRFQRLPAGFLLGVNLSGQESSSTLESSEQFAVGGPSGVRSYTSNAAAGDSAYLFTVDVSHELADLKSWGVLEGVVFFDQGKVTGDRFASTPDGSNLIKSVGLGLAIVDNNRFKASVQWARRVGTPTSTVGTEEKTSRVWASAQFTY